MAKKVYDEKISKSTDWGGDESTGNLPVAGSRVQEFIKEQLNGKAGVFHYDTTNNRYIVFSDVENRDAYLADPSQTSLIIGTFDAPFNYSAEITLSSPVYVAILAETKNNYIDFTFDTKNKNGQSVGEAVIVTYTFIKGGIKKTVTEKYQYGASVHFKIDDYISTGSNTITVGIVGQNTLAATTVGITYQVVDLLLTDTYDISQSYNLIKNPASTAAIPYFVSGYGTKIMEWWLDGVLLDYVKVEDEIVDVSTTRTKYISLANLSQGIHSLQYRTYTVVDGEKFYSNILYRGLIILTGANNNPIVAVSATILVGNDIVTSGGLQLYGITQYIPYELKFAVCNPSSVISTDATIAVDGKTDAIVATHNGEVATYTIRSTEYGLKTLTITAGTTVCTVMLNISKSSTSLEPVTDALQLDLISLGKSNNDINKEEWSYGAYSAEFTGFSWNKTSGWNNNRLLVTNGAHVDINIPPLSPDPTFTGKTLEFELSTSNVSDDKTVICDLRNNSGTGLLITASEAVLTSSGGAKVSTKFKSEENIRITFVINKKAGVANKGLAFIYVNGELSGATSYASTDNFTSGKNLSIGGTLQADVELKALRFYDAALNSDQILNNYMLYRDSTEEMLAVYDRNNIYEEGTQNFSVDKLATYCPVVIFTGDIPTLENTTDKNTTIYVDIEFINMQDLSKSFTAKGIRLRPQGTSSMGYPKKNFRPYTGYGTMWDNLGNVIVDGLYSFAERAQPVNVWCLKADYAESSGSHNTGIARLWNQVMYDAQVNGEYVLRTEAQKAAVAAGYPYDVRTTVDGFPCNVFYRLNNDSELVYIGKYNFNNDKSTESVFGFRDIPGFDNAKMQCWEVLNNGNHLALFQDTINFDTEWDKAFESRYPDGGTDVGDLKSFSEWVVSTKGNVEKFKAEKWQHLDVYKVAAYYVYLMRFAAVDQVVKNAMLTSENGTNFYYINYDNDTVAGVRNDGLLIYNYDIDRQTIDTSFSALVYAYAGHDSTLWNNLEADDEFMRIVSQVDNALYMAGLSYEKTVDMFDNKQAGKWCERIYNKDAQYKYISPFTDSGTNNLFMLQGSRKAHRRWWLSHRFDLLDSKFVSGAYKAKSIEFKAANAPAGLQFSIVSGNNIYYGYGLNNVPVETGVLLSPGESHTFISKQVINVGDPVRIYSAVNVQELDIHNLMPYLSTLNIAEVYNRAVGTKLKKLVMGVNTSVDNRRNTSLSVISGLSQAKRLEFLDISGYQEISAIDLSNHIYFTTLKAYASGLTGVSFANGSPVSSLELPDTLQVLELESLPSLTASGLNIANEWKSIYSISILNCDRLQAAPLIFNWYSKKTAENSRCSLTLSGIEWYEVDAASLILLGNIKIDGGSFSVKGIIHLTSIMPAQVNELKTIFGENCFDPNNDIYIIAPDGVFISGPARILEGTTAQYVATVFSDYKGRIEYWLMDGDSEKHTYRGATIDRNTGLLTTELVNYNYTARIRAKHIPTQGGVVMADTTVSVVKRTYPTTGVIEGYSRMTVGDSPYTLNVSSSGEITGEYQVEWSVEGDAVTRGMVVIKSSTKTGCVLSTDSVPPETVAFLLKATITNAFTSAVVVTKDIDIFMEGVIMTKTTNPTVLAKCHEAGWAANENYMTEEEADAVTDIGEVFRNISTAYSFDEFEYFTGITNIPEYAFNRSRVTSIKIPKNVTSILNSAFESTNLAEITIPESVTSLGSVCFRSNSLLTKIILPARVVLTGFGTFQNCDKLKEVNLPVTMKKILSQMFTGCKELESIIIPESVTEIESDAFSNCRILSSIALPDGITAIGGKCFYGCVALSTMNLEHTKITQIPYECFCECAFEEISLPESITKIDYAAFLNCSKLKHFKIPSKCTNIYAGSMDSPFMGCTSLEYFEIDPTNTGYSVENGVLFSKDKTTLELYPYGKKDSLYIVPDSVTKIGASSFRRKSYSVNGEIRYEVPLLESITIPSGITMLGDYCFEGNNFSSFEYPDSLVSVGNGVLKGSIRLTEITVPKKEFVTERMFYQCYNLQKVVLPDDTEKLPYAFATYCKNLTTINIPDSVTDIGEYAFQDCKSLESIVLPNIPRLKSYLFYGCTKLKSISIKASVAPAISNGNIPFGNYRNNYTGYDTRATGENIIYVPSGATGYDIGEWLDPLQNAEKCGFTISYTL